MKIQFYIQTENNPAPVYVRFNDGRKFDLRTKTDLVIDPKNWDAEKWKPGFPKTNLRDAVIKKQCNTLSAKLKEIDTDLTEKYNSCKNKLEINKDWLNSYFRPQQNLNAIPSGLTSYFEYYELTKKHELKKPSIVKLNVVKHLLQRMETNTKSKFEIYDIDENFKNKFLSFSIASGYAPNTTARNFKFIKTVCYHAEGNGIIISPKLKHIVMKTFKVEKIFLSPEDLALIEKTKFKEDHLSNAKDWLLISCECGQRVSDFMRFAKDMLRYEGGKPLIEFTQVKTNKIMTVPLSKKVMAILQKRKGNFPRKISDQRYNDYIKEVCKQAGITYKIKGSKIDQETKRKISGIYPKWQLVSSHVGRRSFASNNYGRIPTSLLIGATGHTTEQMFLEYIGKSDTQKALQLAEYF